MLLVTNLELVINLSINLVTSESPTENAQRFLILFSSLQFLPTRYVVIPLTGVSILLGMVLLSGGCPGVIAPHLNVFVRVDDPNPSDELRLSMGQAISEPIFPEEIGRPEGVEKIATVITAFLYPIVHTVYRIELFRFLPFFDYFKWCW